MKPKTRIIAKYQSRSRPGTIYDVRQDDDGEFSCNCPAWVYKAGGRRACKHVEDAASKAQYWLSDLTDIPTDDEMQTLQNNPAGQQRWLEAHLKPRQV